jgi:chemotaxis protein histidine kinase CheA
MAYLEDEHLKDIPLFKRDLHSLKGTLAMSNFDSSARIIHSMETNLSDDPYDDIVDNLKKSLLRSQELFHEYFDDLKKVLGLGNDQNYIKVAKEKIEQLELALFQRRGEEEISKCIQSFQLYPVSIVLGKYKKYVASIGDSLMKEVELEYAKTSDEVSVSEMTALDAAFGHIFRNCVDHGIEDSSVREEVSKPATGKVQVCIKRELDNSLEIMISDDGAGINTNILGKKAVESGVWSEDELQKSSEEDKINLIFNSGLSAKEEVSDTSGRGVGMDAVKGIIEDMGGQITVSSKLNVGTKFVIKTQVISKKQSIAS